MNYPITILIPTHNRHNYLARSLTYYQQFKYPILILDSSPERYSFAIPSSIQYVHLPGMAMPDKLFYGFTTINTEFVMMCADDDFMLTDGIDACLLFLQKNRQYSVADGGVLFYKKISSPRQRVIFNLLYKNNFDVRFDSRNISDRLKSFFEDYRSVFYGVHYTENLKEAYSSCRYSFRNLYLNEYITALLPIALGFCKILPVVTGIRESTEISDTSTTVNIDSMFESITGYAELRPYLDCIAKTISSRTILDEKECRELIELILKKYAVSIITGKNEEQKKLRSVNKKAGKLIGKIPVIGKKILHRKRWFAGQKEISFLIKTNADTEYLNRVEDLIKQFQSTC